jgi:hypothetical protein
MTTQNWGEIMTSKDALRKIGKIVANLTPEDRMAVVSLMCCDAKDDDELEMQRCMPRSLYPPKAF